MIFRNGLHVKVNHIVAIDSDFHSKKVLKIYVYTYSMYKMYFCGKHSLLFSVKMNGLYYTVI